MGLDIYAGTLTRYYTHNWKTVVQQFAEENGLDFQTIGSQEVDDDLSTEETLEIVTQWRNNIIDGLKLDPKPLWNEDYDTTPYYTDKPDWDALNALLLYIAAKYSNKEVPIYIEKGMDIYNKHPIVKEFVETKDFTLTLFDGNGWWLPINKNIMFNYVLPNQEESPLTTSALLLAELKKYNSFEWNADRDTILSWSKTEGYPADGTYTNGIYLVENPHNKYQTESLAKYAFSILWQAAEFSLEHGVVIVYDY